MSDWRIKISDFLEDYGKIHIYAVDPGAVATLTPFYEEAIKKKKAGLWFAEGWALQNPEPHYIDATLIPAHINDIAANDVVFMGQQVNFEQAYDRLACFRQKSIKTIFVSDHWKDIANLFAPRPDDKPILPDRLLVPDHEAFELQRETLPSAGISPCEVDKCLEVFLHPGVERALDMINAVTPAEIQELRNKYSIKQRSILMLLDNVDRKGTEALGFYWQNCLSLALKYMETYEPETTLLVKPHPRQDSAEIKDFVKTLSTPISLSLVEEKQGEPFIALCDEIWGMTTVLLVIAQKYGKPIRAFMAERTAIGALDSNPHIEPYTILNTQDFEFSRKQYGVTTLPNTTTKELKIRSSL